MKLKLVNASMDISRDIALTDEVFEAMKKELRALLTRNPSCLVRFECDWEAAEFLDILAIRHPGRRVEPAGCGTRPGREFHGIPIIIEGDAR